MENRDVYLDAGIAVDLDFSFQSKEAAGLLATLVKARGIDPKTEETRSTPNEHPLFDRLDARVESVFGPGTVRRRRGSNCPLPSGLRSESQSLGM